MDMKGKLYNYSMNQDGIETILDVSCNYDYNVRGRNNHLNREQYIRFRKNPKYWNN